MNRYTKFLSAVLSLILCLNMLPAAAHAEDNSGDFTAVAEEAAAPQNECVSETVEDSDAAGDIVADAPAMSSAETDAAKIADEPAIEETVIADDAALDDNDDLFAGYVNQAFYSNSGVMLIAADTAGDQLTGNNLILYNALKSKIEDVAAGNTSSTSFNVLLSKFTKTYEFTPEDLGVDEITSENVKTLYKQALGIDINRVVKALMADCPYELYWFDKAQGYITNADYTISGGNLVFRKGGSVYVGFRVSADYAADPMVTPSYSTDEAKTGAASLAAANAQQVVAAAADYTDYDKLAYYRQQICELTSYNSEAAEDPEYCGSPWQLIYVFDGDPDTNVVCDGYAKAFLYLCDLTQFESYEIYCITVTGTMQYNSDSANHMWNIVHMPDGKNYLVDVTNCDTGTIGAPDNLFLRGSDTGSVDEGYCIQVTDSKTAYYYYDSEESAGVYPDSYLELSTEDSFNALDADHAWSDWTMDDTTGIHTRTCAVCGLTETCIPGDVNRDYEVNQDDLLLLKQTLSGIDTEIYTEGADVNWDGNVNLIDLLLLKRQLANT